MKRRDVVWHKTQTSREERIALMKQKGCVLWLTGLSGSGKSTIAHALEKELITRGHVAYTLDGDNVRHGLCSDLGFSDGERMENIRRISEVARLLTDANIICITAFISPFRRVREQAKAIIGSDRFTEIYVATPLEECERRDVKGMYKKARAGKIADFTGISSPYESPQNPGITLDTCTLSLEDCTDRLMDMLHRNNIINSAT